MEQLNKKVTEYIRNSEDFAKPILEHWRQLVHETCPNVDEAIKWGIPHFDYKGDFMYVMASYKNHCSFSFIKAELMKDKRLKENKNLKPIQRFLGKITSLSDLPSDKEFVGFLKEAMILNDKGIKVVAKKSDKPKVIETPDYFVEKLATNLKAKEIFETKSDSFRKNYLIWITDAKTESTRNKRIEQSLEWIAEGKDRFWKYAK
ncbi:YdeI/OmpD-associated family protein [Leeuwenhoekiella parthenopeia]|uniref:YdeI/OmpD-associated family protein n=1 Tax=Leeuwenhoekiella parthenopeia TaxID=2890320 RepID=A0ABS8GVA6_9FLAO|nr:YdeI/OmpD-associated family protein [Leeuwenhoekiella parthenopeia]MCC4213595.1 YdeI/OmpD-associated family protein [Leeuwenhoekiella parthenopeia]